MPLTAAQIQNTRDDGALLKLLQSELNSLFPPDMDRDPVVFQSRLQNASRGLRAMEATFELDVSLAVDDLAWHFANHADADLVRETSAGLRELEAMEIADVFDRAAALVQPRWAEMRAVVQADDPQGTAQWLETSGLQKALEPLTRQLWQLLKAWPMEGLTHYWVTYARKYPERCAAAKG